MPENPSIIALVGNPNSGKSTLFNALTGKNQKVGNYAGITVEVDAAVAGEEIAAMMALTAPLLDPGDTRTTCIALAEHVGARREVWQALLAGGASGHLREQFVRLASQVPTHGFSDEVIPTDLGVIFGVSATVEILAWWLRQAPDYPAEKVAELLDRLVISPTVGSATGN